MKKFILAISILLSASIACHSQIYVDNQGNVYDQRQTTSTTTTNKTVVNKSNYSSGSKFDASKLTFGGNLSLQFGDYTVVGISPQVGYDFNKYFTAGAGLGYTYYKDKYYDYKWNASYLSFDLFGRVYPIEYIVLGIQPEISRMWQTVKWNDGYKQSESKFVPSFLVGVGLRFQGMIAMIQYDVVQDKNSPYGDNIFYSVGYTFRF